MRIAAGRAEVLPIIGEIFREYGYEGASLSLIGKATGLGKGSLYHFFPGGKEEMASAVLADIDNWFETNLFMPLRDGRTAHDAAATIEDMFESVSRYFRSGQRVCLVGVMALGDARERFAAMVNGYFTRWIEALAGALALAGLSREMASQLAEEIVTGIQGAIVLARALGDAGIFDRALDRLRRSARSPTSKRSRAFSSA